MDESLEKFWRIKNFKLNVRSLYVPLMHPIMWLNPPLYCLFSSPLALFFAHPSERGKKKKTKKTPAIFLQSISAIASPCTQIQQSNTLCMCQSHVNESCLLFHFLWIFAEIKEKYMLWLITPNLRKQTLTSLF